MIFILIFITAFLYNSVDLKAQEIKQDTLTFAFWNMENLFDTIDDTDKNDSEFTPIGRKKWTKERLRHKLSNMSQVIKMMSKSGGPDLLGMCEVEHQSLVEELIKNYLKNKNYGIAYKESPDKRGIDNGLIYNNDKFNLLSVEALHVELPSNYPTRDILKVILKTNNNDTLYVFINHWPSRRGGQEKSEKNRLQAAQTLRNNIEELNSTKQNPNILIMGDFNDTPTNKSFRDVLKAKPLVNFLMKIKKHTEQIKGIYNLAYETAVNRKGTMKYRKVWYMLDQIIVSTAMLREKGFTYLLGSFKIFKPNFIIEKTGRYKGSPLPTYGGNNYLGGYSDHFPVLAKFIINY
ncbi:MAG: endonuclease/exonuclease/phosphatase family protein [Bacteroidetes bacterium]|nr:endonuclease/exonuclease/phosphatase family protein [Bacteroidota bacterium]